MFVTPLSPQFFHFSFSPLTPLVAYVLVSTKKRKHSFLITLTTLARMTNKNRLCPGRKDDVCHKEKGGEQEDCVPLAYRNNTNRRGEVRLHDKQESIPKTGTASVLL